MNSVFKPLAVKWLTHFRPLTYIDINRMINHRLFMKCDPANRFQCHIIHALIWGNLFFNVRNGKANIIQLCKYVHPGASTFLQFSIHGSYVQTVRNHRRLLIIDDKSLPHKQRRASTRLLIFKIRFSSEPPQSMISRKVPR